MSTRNKLNAGEVSSKLRNSNNRANTKFLHNQIGEGTLNPNSVTSGPPDLPIVRTGGSRGMTGTTRLGTGANVIKPYMPVPRLSTFIKNGEHNPDTYLDHGRAFTGGLNLTKNITLGAYLNGATQRVNPADVTLADQDNLLKYLYVQAEMLKSARSRPEFQKFDIKVEDGVYVYEDVETRTTGDLADYGAYGRAISYSVRYFKHGGVDALKTFQLAEYWATLPWYDKIIVDYSNFENTTAPKIKVFLVLPELDDVYNGTWQRKQETSWNLQTMSEALLLLDLQGYYT